MSATKYTIYVFKKQYLHFFLHLFKEDIPQPPAGWDSDLHILKVTAMQQLPCSLYHLQSRAIVPRYEVMVA